MPTDNREEKERRRRSSGSRSQRRQKRGSGRRTYGDGVNKIMDQLDDIVFGCNPIRLCDEDDHRNLKGCLSDERYTNGEAAELMRDRPKEAFVHADRSSSELLTDDGYDSILQTGSESSLNTDVSTEGIASDGGDIKKSGNHTLLEDAPLVPAPKTLTPPVPVEEEKAISSEKKEEAATALVIDEDTSSSPRANRSIPLPSDIPTGGPTRSFFESETPRTGSRRSSAKNFDTFPSPKDENITRQVIPEPNDEVENTNADSSAATATATAPATIALSRAESSKANSSAEAETKFAAIMSLLGEPSLITKAVDDDNTTSKNAYDDVAPNENKEIDDLNVIVETIGHGVATSNTEKSPMEKNCCDSPEEGMVPDHQTKEEKKEEIKDGDDENNDKHEVHMPSSTGPHDHGGDGKDELDLMVEKVDTTKVEDETMSIQRTIATEIGATTTTLEDKPVVEAGNTTEEDDHPSCSVLEAVPSSCDDDQGKHGSENNLEKMVVSNEITNGTKAEDHSGAKEDTDGSSTQGTVEDEEDRSAAFAVPFANKDQSDEDIEVGYEEDNEKIQKSHDDDTKKTFLGALCCGWKCVCLLVVICIIIILLGAVLGTAEKRNSKQMAAVGGTAAEYPSSGGDGIGTFPSTGDNLPSASPTSILGPVSDSPTVIEVEPEDIDNRPDDEEDGSVINFGATQPSDEEEVPTLTDKNGLLQHSIENSPIATPSSTPTIGPTAFPSSAAPTKIPSTAPVSTSPTQGPTTASPVSDAPTRGPTASPVSDAPTQGPTAPPVSGAPTRSPSTSPVSGTPTLGPSSSPIAQEYTVPSANESAGGDVAENVDKDSSTTAPTQGPSTSLPEPTSAGPTSRPTTASSSANPTTQEASDKPTTSEPSAAPTSSSPTVSPTKVTSESPSSKPTTSEPSAAPTSSSPTVSPTKVASESPSSMPTTAAPTSNPTSSPTHLPTSPAIVWEESSPGHLVTNYNTGKATDGIMLAITAKSSSVTITSIDVLLDSMDTDIPVELLMMQGSYFGYELYSRIWRSVGDYVIPQGNGPSRATTIQGIGPITIPSGKTIGLYIVFPEGHKMLIGGSGEISSDGDIRIYSGSSVPANFMSVDRGVGWSGAIKYSIVEED